MVCLLLLTPPYLGIPEEALTQCLEGRIAKSLLQNSLECDALAKLQDIMKRLPNAQAKRHDSLQPRQLGGIKTNKKLRGKQMSPHRASGKVYIPTRVQH